VHIKVLLENLEGRGYLRNLIVDALQPNAIFYLIFRGTSTESSAGFITSSYMLLRFHSH
jgi:hypothetical protein